jgi:SPP1 gp7 family putative phage head morphogenesis protein
MIKLYERRLHGKVEVVFDGHRLRVDALIRNASKSDKGFRLLRDAIDVEIQNSITEAYNVSKTSLLGFVADQVSYTYQTIENSIGRIWKTQRPSRRVAEDLVLVKPLYKDRTLSQGWAGLAVNERKLIETVIRKGVAKGDSLEQIALDVRKGKIHRITRNRARTLTTTAITSIYAQADHEVYAANEPALLGWQYVSIMDSYTTDICIHRDAHIYAIGDTEHLPPAHWGCRSTTTPVVKAWNDLSNLEGVAHVRRRNLSRLSDKQKAFYDGQTPLRETYNDWLMRQDKPTQLRHLGDYQKLELFRGGMMPISKFTNAEGNSIGIRELRQLSDSSYTTPGNTHKFAVAKDKLNAMQLGAASPEDFFTDAKMRQTLKDYYILQTRELDGTLSLTNYRGNLIGTKRQAKRRVVQTLPREDQMVFNPVTGKYDDARLFQPSPGALANNLRLTEESAVLKTADKEFIKTFMTSLEGKMSVNERAVVADNLRILFTRYRENPAPWINFKAVSQAQIKYDVMNTSDFIETTLRRDSDLLKKLKQDNYIDPVLGPVQLQDLHDNFIKNIYEKNKWEDSVAPKIARELRDTFDKHLPVKLRLRLSDQDLQQFYLRFAHRLSLADSPDFDQLAAMLGRDLYNMSSMNGTRRQWFTLGSDILNSNNQFFNLETYGVQKRRMKSRMSGALFGPYYDTFSYNLRITDPRIQKYSQLTRKVELGLRVSVVSDENRLVFRKGYKTYFIDRGLLGYEDTRIPITSTSSFSDFPEGFIDADMVNALNWASKTKYRVDDDFYDFTMKLLDFQDDKGKAKYYNNLNEYRHYITSRGDSYERFKAMEWLRTKNSTFSNHPFIDHRARIYDRGLISPQSGETFRPFLSTEASKVLGETGYLNLQDQIGAFLGGLNDTFEGPYNSLSFTGRQKIADKWRSEMVKIGNHMLRGKPGDIRAILDSPVASMIEGEELGKFYRFALESAKIDAHLRGDYTNLTLMNKYKTALALEQDASSSGAQIIALTTRNKQLAELSNVIPTTQKKRLYDEIAAATYNDPRFKKLNEKLGLTEKDLRKAAKAQNMVTFYGAGERTGILNVEGKLAKILDKDTATLVVRASDRDTVLNEISARIARYERFDPDTTLELRALRENVKDIFNKGLDPGDDILEQLYFLDSKTKDLVTKMSANYDKVVTPEDFKAIAKLMSEHLAEQVPILKHFTKFFGRLAEEFLINAKPSNSAFDWKSIAKIKLLGGSRKGYVLSDTLSEILGIKAGEPVSEKILRRFAAWDKKSTLSEILFGVKSPEARRTGATYLKVEIAQLKTLNEIEFMIANKLPKSWTNVPWVNFDGKIIEQNFTQTFEARLVYKDRDGKWITNILQVPQKTEISPWEAIINKSGKINDIADATKARTAFAVNGNHSNDAVLVKKFHLWGSKNGIPTSTIHDAFFANAADMLQARQALRQSYANALEKNVIKMTLDEMLARGLPREIYDRYLNEAIETGLIPVVGRSRIDGKLLTDTDILMRDDILKEIPTGFKHDFGWYGVG